MSEAIGTFTWSADAAGTGATTIPVTVPAGVTTDHLGIMVWTVGSATDRVFTATGWSALGASVTAAAGVTFAGGAMYRIGGMTEGQVFNFTTSPAAGFTTIAIAWYDSPGLDVVGAVTHRSGTVNTSTCASVASTAGGPVVFIGWEKSTGLGTTITSLTQGTTDVFREGDYATSTASVLIASKLQAEAGATGANTITYSSSSARGSGVTVALDPVPVTEVPGPEGESLQAAMQRVSGTNLDAQGAANVWAGTTGLDLLGALNTKAGNARSDWLDLLGVLNQLAGTTGLDQDAAARAITA